MSVAEFDEIEHSLDIGENDLVPVSLLKDEEFVLSPNNSDSILVLDLKRKLTRTLQHVS